MVRGRVRVRVGVRVWVRVRVRRLTSYCASRPSVGERFSTCSSRDVSMALVGVGVRAGVKGRRRAHRVRLLRVGLDAAVGDVHLHPEEHVAQVAAQRLHARQQRAGRGGQQHAPGQRGDKRAPGGGGGGGGGGGDWRCEE
eukprot:scaffold76716_cov42-Phaeocystis_antarctica.AAC.1